MGKCRCSLHHFRGYAELTGCIENDKRHRIMSEASTRRTGVEPCYLYRVRYSVDINRVYHYKTPHRRSWYTEWLEIPVEIAHDVDKIRDFLYRYGWAKYGLTDEHYNGCRACDPSEDVDPEWCGFKLSCYEPVPVKSYVPDTSQVMPLNEEILKLFEDTHKAQRNALVDDRRRQREEKKKLEQKRDREISEIKKKYAKLL